MHQLSFRTGASHCSHHRIGEFKWPRFDVSPTGLCVMAFPQIIRVMNDHDLALKETVTWGSQNLRTPQYVDLSFVFECLYFPFLIRIPANLCWKNGLRLVAFCIVLPGTSPIRLLKFDRLRNSPKRPRTPWILRT